MKIGNAGVRVFVMIVVAALATGLSAAAIHRVGDVFQLPEELAKIGGGNISPKDQQAVNAGRTEIGRQRVENGASAFEMEHQQREDFREHHRLSPAQK